MHVLSTSGIISTLFSLSTVSTVVPVLGAAHHQPMKQHHSSHFHARSGSDSPEGDLVARGEFPLDKRFDGSRFSFYDAGLGACGGQNTNSDFIVALNTPQWDGGSHCFQTVTITVRGKTAQAQIADRCVECPYGALDFSRGLFDFFASQDEGLIYGSWNYGGGEPAPAPEPSPTPTPSPTPAPTPTPLPSTQESSSSIQTSSSTTTSSVQETSTSAPSSSLTSSETLSTTESASITASGSADNSVPTDVLNQFNLALVQLADFAEAAVSGTGN